MLNLKNAKVKIKKMWQSGGGCSWPVFEVRLASSKENLPLCKCGDADDKPELSLEKAEP